MKLSQALKAKNRLAGELVRQQQILHRENARRSDSKSQVDCDKVWAEILRLSEELGKLKARIAAANVGIYPALERMAELKARVGFVQNLPKRDDEEVQYVGRTEEKLSYQWSSFIGQEKSDAMVAEIQEQINALQDQVDNYNATTEVA